jgi:lipopolysaccharide biosynthesis glycosyltransferase
MQTINNHLQEIEVLLQSMGTDVKENVLQYVINKTSHIVQNEIGNNKEYAEVFRDRLVAIRNEINQKMLYNKMFHTDDATAHKIANDWNGVVKLPEYYLRAVQGAIPVVMSTDDNYAPFCAVMLQSLLDNTNQYNTYHFYILYRSLSDKSITMMKSQINAFPHCKIEFIDVSETFKNVPIRAIKGFWTSDIYSRFIIPYLFTEYSKVIYLDVDMLAQADIAELYNIDLQGKPLGAVYDMFVKYKFENKEDYNYLYENSAVFLLGLQDWKIFNSGLLLIDTAKFREITSFENLLRFTIWFTHRAEWFWADQCVLNLLLQTNWYKLPIEWNANNWNLIINVGVNDTYFLQNKILHFCSAVKPWNSNIIPEVCNHYRRYASKVPLYIERFPTHKYHIETTRNELIEKYFPKNSVGMEVGVFMGELAEFLYNTLEPQMLYLVDPFPAGSVYSGDKDGTNGITVHNLREYAIKKIVPKYKDKQNVQIIADFSYNVLPRLQDGALDWIYIDGDHSYDGSFKDLLLARQKVKRGGIIAGHNYVPQFGVMKAVDDFCEHFSLTIEVMTFDGCPSWLIRNV